VVVRTVMVSGRFWQARAVRSSRAAMAGFMAQKY